MTICDESSGQCRASQTTWESGQGWSADEIFSLRNVASAKQLMASGDSSFVSMSL